MKVNLHTHTYRCHHADGTDEEYVLAAIEAGYTKLGFADHTPFPYENGYVRSDKMLPNELNGYIDSIRKLQQKYAGQIEILLGLECESVPRFFPYLREVRKQLDFMILGSHGDGSIGDKFFGRIQDPALFDRYLDATVTGMESGMFLYLAHPDVCFLSYPEFDRAAERVSRALCREAKRLNMPIEYNLKGLDKILVPGALGYPCDGFWRIAAEENNTAVIGIDAHSPKAILEADLDTAKQYLNNLGIPFLEDSSTLLEAERTVKKSVANNSILL